MTTTKGRVILDFAMEDRKRAIVSGFITLAFLCFIDARWFYKNCTPLDKNCLGLLFFGGIVIVITILFIENYIREQKKRGEWYEKKRESRISHRSNQKRVWVISVGRVLLTSLLLSLSAVIQGGFVMLFSGIFIGLGVDVIIRGLTGKLPPPKCTDRM